MASKKILRRLGSLLFDRSFQILVLQVLGTIVLIYLTNIWVKDPNIQLVAELGIAAFGLFAASQTLLLTADFRRYITRELLAGLASSQGRIISHVAISKSFKEIFPGDEYTIEFLIEGQQLIEIPDSKMITPFLRMEPPLFQGDTDESSEQFSIWRGQPIPCNLKEDGSWELSGQISFDTYKINPRMTMESSATLNLGFQGENRPLLDLRLGGIPVHLITPHEIFQDLIRMETLKKLPSGYHVLAISRDYKFHTNLVFLSRRFHELKSDEKYSDRVRRLEVAIAHFINQAFIAIANRHPSKKLKLVKYDPELYESELNFPPLMDSMLASITSPQQSEPTDKVLVAIYQTREFIMQLKKERGFGICLFGFPPIVSSDVHVLFDLCRLELNHEETGNPCQVDQAGLERLAESSKEFFERYAPQLSATLTRQPKEQIPQGQFPSVSLAQRGPEPQSRMLENLLELVRIPAQTSVRHGCFVDSEPAITPYWVNLGIFADALYEAGVQDALEKTIIYVIDRVIQSCSVHPKDLFILNLCTPDSGIADELPILWDFQHHSLPTGGVSIDRRSKVINLPDQITDITVTEEVIVLTPFDSYAHTLKTVLQAVREYNNAVICIISLFSMAKTWDYLSASHYLNVIPLFRVHPDYSTGLIPLTRMPDYRRAKPWLFHD